MCSIDAFESNQQCVGKIPLGESCRSGSDVCLDRFASCQQNICKCRSGFNNVDGICVQSGSDGRLDGACIDGVTCLDRNTVCSGERCRCAPNFFPQNSVCVPTIEIGRPCSAGEVCRDAGAVCVAGRCQCDTNYFEKNGRCRVRGSVGTPCLFGDTCIDNLLVCTRTDDGRNLCLCRSGFEPSGDTCRPQDNSTVSTPRPGVEVPLFGVCNDLDYCVDPFAACVNGTCLCVTSFVAVEGTCLARGDLGAPCRNGAFCDDSNSLCENHNTQNCVCRRAFFEQ